MHDELIDGFAELDIGFQETRNRLLACYGFNTDNDVILAYFANKWLDLPDHVHIYAAREGRTDVMVFFNANGHAPTLEASTEAASEGRIDTLEWLKETDFLAPQKALFISAAYHGKIDVLEWLLRIFGGNWFAGTRDVYRAAWGYGRLEVVEWLWDHNCPLEGWSSVNQEVMNSAEARGIDMWAQ